MREIFFKEEEDFEETQKTHEPTSTVSSVSLSFSRI